MADNNKVCAINIDDHLKHPLTNIERHHHRSPRRCCLKAVCILLVGFVLVAIAAWNYKLQMQVRDILIDVHQIKQVSITQTRNSAGKQPNTAFLKQSRVPRTSGQTTKSPLIHLGADDGAPYRPNFPNCSLDGKANRVMKLWKEETRSGGVTYDSNSGKVKVPQTGYYYVYAQLRLGQVRKLPTYATFTIMVAGKDIVKDIVSATLNDTIHSQRVAALVKLNKDEEVYVEMGLSNRPFICFSKKIFTYFGLYFVSY